MRAYHTALMQTSALDGSVLSTAGRASVKEAMVKLRSVFFLIEEGKMDEAATLLRDVESILDSVKSC